MTIRKRKTNPTDDPEEFEVPLTKGTLTFRSVLIMLVLSGTPMGQQMLKNFGIYAPTQESVTNVTHDIDSIRKDIASLKESMVEQKENYGKLDAKVTGFLIDFEKYKPKAAAAGSN